MRCAVKKALKIIGYILVTIIILLAVVPLILPIPPAEGTKPVGELVDADSQFIKVGGVDVH